MSYFADKDQETVDLINECIKQLDPCVRTDYLINCLTMKCMQGKTPKEIFKAELKAMKSLEGELHRIKTS